jgi:tetratricopeptide (TPR) repeat protein
VGESTAKKDSSGPFLLQWILSKCGTHHGSRRPYEQAIRLNPNHVLVYNNKGNTLQELNRKEEALAAYEKARQLE